MVGTFYCCAAQVVILNSYEQCMLIVSIVRFSLLSGSPCQVDAAAPTTMIAYLLLSGVALGALRFVIPHKPASSSSIDVLQSCTCGTHFHNASQTRGLFCVSGCLAALYLDVRGFCC